MKNLKTTFKAVTFSIASVLTLSISINTTTQAILVSDPTSYSYYIKQIKKSIEQGQTLKGTLSEAQHLSGAFDGFMADLRSKFDFVGNIQKNLKSQLSTYENYKRSLSISQKKKLDFSRKFDMRDLRDVIDTNLDGIYVDPTNPDYSTSQIKKLRTVERQRLLKEGLIKTEQKLALLEQKYKGIEDLAIKAKNTKNSKESADLNNAILLEILAALHSLVDITATLGQAEMASGFINYSAEAHARKERADKKPSSGYPGFANKREYGEWYDGCHAFKRKHGHTNTTFNGVDCPRRAVNKREEKFKMLPDSAKSWGF